MSAQRFRYLPATTAVLVLLAIVATASEQARPPAEAKRAMAITFDDLPYVAVGSPDFVRDGRRVTDELLGALRRHHAPATAFVNEVNVTVPGEMDARVALLKAWVDAGATLGNHTYSHRDFNRLSAAEFEDDIVRGEAITRRLMERRGPYQLYFRHPMTHTGDTVEKKRAVEAFLAARGYKVTPHTIENSDFIFNVPYTRARRSSDAAMMQKLAAAYVDFSLAATGFAEQVSPKIFSRDIPQTLLIHANDINADSLDTLLAALERRGYRFVTLDAAMSDEAYATPDTAVSASGPTWLWRWMKSTGMSVSFKDDPEVPPWVMQLYERR